LANFKIIANLERHIQIHAKKFVFEIPKGNAAPKAIDGPPKLALYPCDFCSEAFEYKRHLSQHLLSEHRDRQINLKCDKCSFQTDNTTRLREHSSRHQKKKKEIGVNEKLKCEKCKKQFKTKNLLKLHSKEHLKK
jgi:Zinc finger, C2H2 type